MKGMVVKSRENVFQNQNTFQNKCETSAGGTA